MKGRAHGARAAFVFTIDGDRIVELALTMEPAQLAMLSIMF